MKIKTNLFLDGLKASKMAENAHKYQDLTLQTKKRLFLKWFNTLSQWSYKTGMCSLQTLRMVKPLEFSSEFPFLIFLVGSRKGSKLTSRRNVTKKYLYLYIYDKSSYFLLQETQTDYLNCKKLQIWWHWKPADAQRCHTECDMYIYLFSRDQHVSKYPK